jgi:hypothetical protein
MVEFEVQANWKPREVACRVAMIVGVNPHWDEDGDEGPPWENRPNTFQLDEGNDWFLTVLGDNRYRLNYRYGQNEMLQGLQAFLNWVFK